MIFILYFQNHKKYLNHQLIHVFLILADLPQFAKSMEAFRLVLASPDILGIHQTVIQNAWLIPIVPATWPVSKKNAVIHVQVHVVYMLTALYSIMSLYVLVLTDILEMHFLIVTLFRLVSIHFSYSNWWYIFK